MNSRLIIGLGTVLAACALVIGFVFYKQRHEIVPMRVSDERAVQVSGNPQGLIAEAMNLEDSGHSTEAHLAYQRIAEEYPESRFGELAKAKLNQLGLESYLRSLDAAAVDLYVVKSGDNLTRIGKEFGVTPASIRIANGLKSDTIRPGMPLKIMKERWKILIDKSQNLLSLKASDKIVKVYPIATGKDDSTPVGDFKITNRLVNPTWYYEGKVIKGLDPENPLGTRWLGFDLDHYGIHGTNDPDIIGKHATHGCVRMKNPDVEEMFALLPVGTEVTIIE